MVAAPVSNIQREKQETASRWLSPTSDKIYFTRTSRDLKRIDIVQADAITGEPKVAVAERSNTYIELQPMRLLSGGKEIIHWSERDGWGHYYLYGADGKVKRQITSGEFVGTGVEAVDEKTRTLFFNAAGRVFHLDARSRYRRKFQVSRTDPSFLLFDPPRLGLRETVGISRAFNVSLA